MYFSFLLPLEPFHYSGIIIIMSAAFKTFTLNVAEAF
jgi:hypothetical protein